MHRSLFACALTIAVPAVAQDAPLPPDEAALRAHVQFLADDALKGREAGSPEYAIAAAYVAAQFAAAGLRPGGDAGSYQQRVPLIAYRPDGPGTLAWNRRAFVYGKDYLPGADPAGGTLKLSAPIVFVGHGIVDAAVGRDDYRGADVRGKIVAVLDGAPGNLPPEIRASLAGTKATTAAARGAIGVITLLTPRAERTRPFARLVEYAAHPRMTWAEADGRGHVDGVRAPQLATLSQSGAAKLFAGAATPWATIATQADADDATFTPQPLMGTLTASLRTALTPVTSSNVVGILPGTDPTLRDEVVVLSAHLDHIGITAPDARGDTINNGALDNAVGIASLIEEARRFATSGKPPRRTIVFLAVTAEEKGLVGADYFANHPTVPRDRIVADVNLDMPILTYKFEDIVAFGGDRSTLGPIIARAAKAAGVILSPDPIPEEGIFVRSDHYRFVQQGIPSVYLWPGQKGPGKAATTDFLATRYHRPSDDLSQPILWDQGVRFVDVNYRVAREIADDDARPLWNKGDYFGTLFGGPMTK